MGRASVVLSWAVPCPAEGGPGLRPRCGWRGAACLQRVESASICRDQLGQSLRRRGGSAGSLSTWPWVDGHRACRPVARTQSRPFPSQLLLAGSTGLSKTGRCHFKAQVCSKLCPVGDLEVAPSTATPEPNRMLTPVQRTEMTPRCCAFCPRGQIRSHMQGCTRIPHGKIGRVSHGRGSRLRLRRLGRGRPGLGVSWSGGVGW